MSSRQIIQMIIFEHFPVWRNVEVMLPGSNLRYSSCLTSSPCTSRKDCRYPAVYSFASVFAYPPPRYYDVAHDLFHLSPPHMAVSYKLFVNWNISKTHFSSTFPTACCCIFLVVSLRGTMYKCVYHFVYDLVI